jgi:hypothetical protein
VYEIKSRIRWAGHVAPMGDMKNLYKILVRNPEGKKPFVRPRHGKEDNIKMDIKEMGCDDMDYIRLRIKSSCGFM